MGKIKDKTLNELFNRSVAEKILAVEKLWDNIKESSANDEPTSFEKKLIKERLALYKENPTKVKKWEDVKADYLKKK
jgi:putative addiction module component (TIGR02574 family)